MNDTIKSILAILEDGTPELQIAAAQVLGALKPREAAVSQAIADRLPGAEDYLERHLLTTLAALGTPAAVKTLVAQLEIGGAQADLVAHLLGDLGKDVCPALAGRFDDASSETQTRILSILRRVPGARSLGVMERALLIPELSACAADALIETHIDELETRSRNAVKTRLSKVLQKHEEELAPPSLAVILKVLGHLDGQGARTTLVKYTEKTCPTVVRHAALTALLDVRLTPTQASAFLDFLSADDKVHIVAPTIELLTRVEKWSPASVTRLRRLMSSRQQDLRLFAVRAMRCVSSKEVVKSLTNHLLGDSAEMSAAARESLSHNTAALEPLLRLFLLEKSLDRARLLVQPLHVLGADLSDAQVKSLADKGSRLLMAHEPKAELVLDLLVRVKPEQSAAFLVDKAVRLRRVKKLSDALSLLAFLAQREALDLEGRYQLALVRLLVDIQEGRGEQGGRAGDATMGHFSMLVRDGFPVLDRLKKESIVTPEAMLRVGAHFSEGVGSERRFGSDVLHHVADKHGRLRAGEEARIVLRSEGL